MNSNSKSRRRVLLAVLAILFALFLLQRVMRPTNYTTQFPEHSAPPISSVAPEDADLRILMFGNSHTAMHDLPRTILKMLEQATPDKKYYIDRSPNMDFLADKWELTVVQDLFQSQDWDVIVLQGQKYSVSGRHDYPTEGTEKWISASHKRNIRPILYPEWGQ